METTATEYKKWNYFFHLNILVYVAYETLRAISKEPYR